MRQQDMEEQNTNRILVLSKPEYQITNSDANVNLQFDSDLRQLSVLNKYETLQDISIITDDSVMIGESWKLLSFIFLVKHHFCKLYAYLNRVKPRSIIISFCIILISVNIALSILTFIKVYTNTDFIFLLIIMTFHVIIGFSLMVMEIYLLFLTCCKSFFDKDFFCCITFGRMASACMGICCGFLLIKSNTLYGSIVLVISYFSCCLYITMLILLILSIPFLIIALIIEFFIKLVTNKLKCPKKEFITAKYEYQVYLYNRERLGNRKCVICLGSMSDETKVVALCCHMPHIYHETCILQWIKRSRLCPICRESIKFAVA